MMRAYRGRPGKLEELLLTICEPYEGFEKVEKMVEGTYQTRRQKELQQERERLEQEAQAFTRCLEETDAIPEQIKLAWRKTHEATNPTRSVS